MNYTVESTNKTLWLQHSDNNLINGKMNFDCSLIPSGTPCHSNAGISKFPFTTGRTHRLRLINAGAAGLQHFSIDQHVMTVIANDFVPIVPYNTTTVTLGVGLCLTPAVICQLTALCRSVSERMF